MCPPGRIQAFNLAVGGSIPGEVWVWLKNRSLNGDPINITRRRIVTLLKLYRGYIEIDGMQ